MQVPVAVAAHICDVAVNVLARQVRTGDARCGAAHGQVALTASWAEGTVLGDPTPGALRSLPPSTIRS